MRFLLLNNLFGNKLAQAICWTLLHSLWQGLFIALCACIAILATRKSVSVVRYNIVTALFIAFIIISGLTFLYEWKQSGIVNDTLAFNSPSLFTTILSNYQITVYLQQVNQYLSSYANYIVLAWLIIFCLKAFQTATAIAYTYRIRTQHTQSPANEWKEKLNLFSSQLNIKRKVELLESGLTRIPLVIGHFKPVIFIPIGLLSQVPADQVEAVLWHELAHIRRNDYFVNFFQHVAEAIFFFNPALLWISSVLRTERENCCDDIAIGQTNNKKQFIEALISFKEYAMDGPSFVTAFPGRKNQLLQRVSRIITRQNKSLRPGEKIFFLLGIVILIAFFSISTHLLPEKIITKDQIISEKKQIITEGKKQNPITKTEITVETESPEKLTEHHLPVTKTNLQKNLFEPISKSRITNQQRKKELLDALITKEKMKLDQRQAKVEHEKAILDRDRAVNEKFQAQLNKLLAEKDARKAEAERPAG
jgi:beta-lactamase regulating signal transducer with metallopeptidase domain